MQCGKKKKALNIPLKCGGVEEQSNIRLKYSSKVPVARNCTRLWCLKEKLRRHKLWSSQVWFICCHFEKIINIAKMHISSESLSAAAAHVHSGCSHSPASPEALRTLRHFVSIFYDIKVRSSTCCVQTFFQYA